MTDLPADLGQAGRMTDRSSEQDEPAPSRIAASATVEEGASVGPGTIIWDLVHLRAGCHVGAQCIIGRNAFVDAGVSIGDRSKLQNNVLVYSPAVIEEGVFIGPGAILTNDRYPRAVNPEGDLKQAHDWKPLGVTVQAGASIGAGAVIVGGVCVGSWALVGAGAVVSQDVKAYALVAGVPARQIGWVGHLGKRLIQEGDDKWRCPLSGDSYLETAGHLERSHL
jgi:UDP-2-acetamido-3-amino-2,3-dideoxy-glucuronate N-acetyltransferase